MRHADNFLHMKYGSATYQSYAIGLNATFSGPEKISGRAIRLGLQMATEKINSNGGLLGKPVRIIQTDDANIYTKSRANIESLSQNKDLLAIFGGKHSPLILYSLDIINELGIPYMITWASSKQITENNYRPNYIFRLSANDKDAAHFLIKKSSRKRQQDSYCRHKYHMGERERQNDGRVYRAAWDFPDESCCFRQ